jgi:hypothetical protein
LGPASRGRGRLARHADRCSGPYFRLKSYFARQAAVAADSGLSLVLTAEFSTLAPPRGSVGRKWQLEAITPLRVVDDRDRLDLDQTAGMSEGLHSDQRVGRLVVLK